VACPACLTRELAQCCSEYVTTLVNGADLVPTFCSGSIDTLREDVTRSSWFAGERRGEGAARTLQCSSLLPLCAPRRAAFLPPRQQEADGRRTLHLPAAAEFQRDVRQRMYRALEGSMDVVGAAATALHGQAPLLAPLCCCGGAWRAVLMRRCLAGSHGIS
jgi:hypothetical protein